MLLNIKNEIRKKKIEMNKSDTVEWNNLKNNLKGIVHSKILSFTRPQAVPNLYECLCSAELCTKEDILKNVRNRAVLVPTMEVKGAPKQPGYKLSSEYLPLCSAEQRH